MSQGPYEARPSQKQDWYTIIGPAVGGTWKCEAATLGEACAIRDLMNVAYTAGDSAGYKRGHAEGWRSCQCGDAGKV